MISPSTRTTWPSIAGGSDTRSELIAEQAREEERRRIARELHDDISQQFALLTITVDMLREQTAASAPEVARRLDAVVAQAREIGTSLRQVSHRLYSSRLADLGLSVRAWCEQLAAHYNLDIHVACDRIPSSLRGDLALALFRIVQEAVQNIVRHSGARRATVEISAGPDALLLRVVDDGCGFDVEARDGAGIGLVGMRERLEPFGGRLSINSSRSHGTRLDVSVRIWRAETARA